MVIIWIIFPAIFCNFEVYQHFYVVAEGNRAEMARFAKNFLPILFNLFTTDNGNGEKDRSRLTVLETIKCYFQV